MKIGLTQVYCGEGKGKTTAAVGQGIRAIGQGLCVIMIQFLKSRTSGEIETLKRLEPDFKVFRFEKQPKFIFEMTEEEKEDLKSDIKNALNFSRKVLDTRECDVLILDEILGVLQNNIITKEELKQLIHSKSENVELILTGREFPSELYDDVDYISTINATKHPYNTGIPAREGIEF